MAIGDLHTVVLASGETWTAPERVIIVDGYQLRNITTPTVVAKGTVISPQSIPATIFAVEVGTGTTALRDFKSVSGQFIPNAGEVWLNLGGVTSMSDGTINISIPTEARRFPWAITRDVYMRAGTALVYRVRGQDGPGKMRSYLARVRTTQHLQVRPPVGRGEVLICGQITGPGTHFYAIEVDATRSFVNLGGAGSSTRTTANRFKVPVDNEHYLEVWNGASGNLQGTALVTTIEV